MSTAYQVALWQEEQTEVHHHLIEVIYRDGKRRVIDTANPDDQAVFQDMSVWSAEFVAIKENMKEVAL